MDDQTTNPTQNPSMPTGDTGAADQPMPQGGDQPTPAEPAMPAEPTMPQQGGMETPATPDAGMPQTGETPQDGSQSGTNQGGAMS